MPLRLMVTFRCFRDGALEWATCQQPPRGLPLFPLLLSEFWVCSPLLSMSRQAFSSSGHKLSPISNLGQVSFLSQINRGSNPDFVIFLCDLCKLPLCLWKYGNNDSSSLVECCEAGEGKYVWKNWPGGCILQGKHLSSRGMSNLARFRGFSGEGPERRPGSLTHRTSSSIVLCSGFHEKMPRGKQPRPLKNPTLLFDSRIFKYHWHWKGPGEVQ